MSASKQAEALMNGTLDVGFTRPLDPPFDRQLLSEPLYEDFLMAVLPKDHPQARAPFDLRELAEERFVLIARETASALFDKIIAVCSEAGFSPAIEATGSAWPMVMLLVQSGAGIAILPSNVQHLSAPELVFQSLTNPGASIGMVLAWAPKREGSVQAAFLDLARAHRDRLRATSATRIQQVFPADATEHL
jgi:DNA-binding transcriptional LysR family regulator